MADEHSITIQMGHVPRTSGSTGTVREQEFTKQLGVTLYFKLHALGWETHLVNADPPGRDYPDTKYFLALHCDGSSNSNVGSASFFYPPRDADESWNWGMLWAGAHQTVADYPFGFRKPNYVSSVSTGFYAWRKSRVPDNATPADICLLVEHYFATNPKEAAWAWTPGRIDKMADAHVTALGKLAGHPQTTESEMFSTTDTSTGVVTIHVPGMGYCVPSSPSHWFDVIASGRGTGKYESDFMDDLYALIWQQSGGDAPHPPPPVVNHDDVLAAIGVLERAIADQDCLTEDVLRQVLSGISLDIEP